MLILSKPLTRQPQGAVRLVNNPVLRPIHLLLAPHLRSILAPEVGTLTSPLLAPGDGGIGLKANGAGSGITWASRPLSGGPCVIFGVVRMVASATVAQHVWAQRDGGSPFAQGSMFCNVDHTGGIVSGKLGCIFRFDTNALTQQSISLSNGLHAVAAAWVGGTTVLWSVDGQTRTTENSTNVGTVTNWFHVNQTTQIQTFGGASDNAVLMSGAQEGAATQGALNAFTANPWQLFARRRIWVPVSAGGGGTTPVSSDRSLSWAVRSGVRADQSLAYPVKNAAQQDQPLAYAVKNAAEQSQSLAWTLRAGVQASQALAWPVSSSAQASMSLGYSLRNGVQAGLPISYGVSASIQRQLDLAWSVLNSNGIPVLSDATVFNITGTTARLRVTVTF